MTKPREAKRPEGEVLAGDPEAVARFLDEYGTELLERINGGETDGAIALTEYEAAMELIEMAVQALSVPGVNLPDPVRRYLHQALNDVLTGKEADLALRIRRRAGGQVTDDLRLSAVLAYLELGKRRGLSPAAAKKQTLRQAEILWDGGRTNGWLDKLIKKHENKIRSLSQLSDAELIAIADFDEPRDRTGIK